MSIEISANCVKELRSQTGAGMMDCKKALLASEGNIEIAIENLRKKGLASANKKSHRVATEGIIESYIHAGSRIGVLLELNCETDFVARRLEFHQLAKDIAMQIAASPSVQYVSINDIDKKLIDKEVKIESSSDDLTNKPKNIKEKIVEGRIEKRLKEMSLMDQKFIKNQDVLIDDLIKQNIVLLGENIQVRRFTKFLLGEGIDKNMNDFADEVANIIDKK
uniref:Elongation factor Ts, mitochondrial n=1 Tax=Leiomenia cribrosa TaxID=217483 RepID=A0A4D6WUQ3_9FLOR|nr:Translation elongation factor Ts [Leiomenia cribrosa]